MPRRGEKDQIVPMCEKVKCARIERMKRSPDKCAGWLDPEYNWRDGWCEYVTDVMPIIIN